MQGEKTKSIEIKKNTTAKTQYDFMRESEIKEEDALIPEEIVETVKRKSTRDEYFDFYDDIKTSIKEDW